MVGSECPLNIAVFKILKRIKRFKTSLISFKIDSRLAFSQDGTSSRCAAFGGE
jgi:hypothetical protein